MKIKGKLIPIGGNEAHDPADNAKEGQMQQVDFCGHGILKDVLTEAKGTATKILLVPAASGLPDEMVSIYRHALHKLGCRQVEVAMIESPEEVDHAANLKKLHSADCVFMTGGDQTKLITTLADTEFAAVMRNRYRDDSFIIAGTSAGAAAMSLLAIKDGKSGESLIKGMVETEKGLGLLPDAIIDTHFMQRSRLPRLTEALLRNPGLIGIGLCADTGVVITGGDKLKAIGSGVVSILELTETVQTNYHDIQELAPVYLNALTLRLLAGKARYRIRNQSFTT